MLSSNDEDEMIHCLPRVDARTFVDVIDEARPIFPRYHGTNINRPALEIRHWIRLVSPCWLKRNASGCYTGHVPNMQFFRER